MDWRAPPPMCSLSLRNDSFLQNVCFLFQLLLCPWLLCFSPPKQMNLFLFFLFLPALVPPCSLSSSPDSWKNSSCRWSLCLYCLSEFGTLTLVLKRHLSTFVEGVQPEISAARNPVPLGNFWGFPLQLPYSAQSLTELDFLFWAYSFFSLSSLMSYIIEPILPSVDMHGLTE